MKIWLDDIRPAPENWIWIKTAHEAFEFTHKNWDQIEEISLDHDLGEESAGTGYSFLCGIEVAIAVNQVKGKIPVFHIHSANPVGRKNMERAIESIKRLAL